MALKRGRKPAGAEPVGIKSKLRQAHQWFETLIQPTKSDALSKRQFAERMNGPKLSPRELAETADELERIQAQINPLENQKKELAAKLLAHWGHTGILEIDHPLGNTLISTSYELALDPDTFKKEAGDTMWQKVTERAVEPRKLLAEGKDSAFVQKAVRKSVLVRKLKVAVTPPSSRRPKSGAAEEEDDAA